MMFFKRKSRFLKKGEEDEVLTRDVQSRVLKLEKGLESFNRMIYAGDYAGKDKTYAELHKEFLEMKIKVNSLLDNIKEIMVLEEELKDKVLFNDKPFLNDKYARINAIEESIQEIIGILESQPSIQELKTVSLEKLRGSLSRISGDLSSIKEDNNRLKETYTAIEEKILE